MDDFTGLWKMRNGKLICIEKHTKTVNFVPIDVFINSDDEPLGEWDVLGDFTCDGIRNKQFDLIERISERANVTNT